MRVETDDLVPVHTEKADAGGVLLRFRVRARARARVRVRVRDRVRGQG